MCIEIINTINKKDNEKHEIVQSFTGKIYIFVSVFFVVVKIDISFMKQKRHAITHKILLHIKCKSITEI